MITKQKWITRKDLQANPDTLYLFGDNLIRMGFGGQAGAMRGEPNAVGVVTKLMPDNRESSFFNDDMLEAFKSQVDRDLKRVVKHLEAGGKVIIPEDGLGTGLSDLPARAPECHRHLQKELDNLDQYIKKTIH